MQYYSTFSWTAASRFAFYIHKNLRCTSLSTAIYHSITSWKTDDPLYLSFILFTVTKGDTEHSKLLNNSSQMWGAVLKWEYLNTTYPGFKTWIYLFYPIGTKATG